MKKISRLDTAASVALKILLVVALFCPMSTTMEGNKHFQYYQEFLLVNAVAVVFLFFYTISTAGQRRWNKENKVFCIKFLFVMCCYAALYYLMFDAIQWKWQGINCMISFGFFLFLMGGKNKEWFEKYRIIQFANRCIVSSNILAILVYLKGYASVYWYNFKLELKLPQAFYGEKRFEWIYYHKSQYAFMLLLSLAFILVYRKKFTNKITFGASVAVLCICLYISHVNTAIVGGGVILGSFCVDVFIKNFKKIRLWVKAVVIPLFCIGVFGGCLAAFEKIAAERSILTLGSRTAIWKNAIDLILKRPEGLGLRFTFKKIQLPELPAVTNNGHNIFLNEMLRLSIPVGICFTILFVLILVYALEKKFSFFTLGIWGALMMSVMMDYAVMSCGWTLMVFFFYSIFFLNTGEKKAAIENADGSGSDGGNSHEAAADKRDAEKENQQIRVCRIRRRGGRM